MPFPNSKYSKLKREAKYARKQYAARCSTAKAAAALTALACGHVLLAPPAPPAPPAPLGPAARSAPGYWLLALYEYGACFFLAAAAAFCAPASGNVAQLASDGVTIVRAAGFAAAAANFVELLRARAALTPAEAKDTVHAKGLKSVDGRISYHVPVGSVLRSVLIAFARAVRPAFFTAELDELDFDVSFIYLILTADSQTQKFHADYNSHSRSLVFLIPLDSAHGTTEFNVNGVVTKSDATAGDIVLFNPWLSHRGVATGVLRRCMYVSIRCKSRRSEDADFRDAHPHEKTFSNGAYADCVRRSMAEMEAEDKAK